jgi:hypothetical protein
MSDDEVDNEVNLVTVDDTKWMKKKNYKKKKGKYKESDDNKEKCKHCGKSGHDPDVG